MSDDLLFSRRPKKNLRPQGFPQPPDSPPPRQKFEPHFFSLRVSVEELLAFLAGKLDSPYPASHPEPGQGYAHMSEHKYGHKGMNDKDRNE
jgi:hypothetical protein